MESGPVKIKADATAAHPPTCQLYGWQPQVEHILTAR